MGIFILNKFKPQGGVTYFILNCTKIFNQLGVFNNVLIIFLSVTLSFLGFAAMLILFGFL